MSETEPGGSDRLVRVLARLCRPWVFGLGLFVVALLVRLVGIDWGLPNDRHHWSYHPDEPVIWAYSQQIKPAQGKFTPGVYNYGTFYLTLLRVSTDMVNSYGGGPTKDDGSDFYRAMARYHLAGRWISSLAGAALAWVVLMLLWRRTHWVGAVFGSLAVAFAPGLVIHSRFQTVDVLATFLLALGLLFALRVGDTGDVKKPGRKLDPAVRDALWAGVFFGLSAGTKYTGILGLLALAVVCVYGRKWKELALGTVACLLAFVVSTPGMLLDSQSFWRDFGYEMAHTSQGHGLVFAGTSPGFAYHLGNLTIGLGTVLLLLGLGGLARAAWKGQTWAVAVLVFGVAYYGLIGRAEVKFLRYTFPLIPVLAVGAGWLVGRAHTHPNSRWKAVGALGVLGLGGVFGGGLNATAQATLTMANPDQDPRTTVPALFAPGGALGPGTVGLVSDPWFYTPDFYPEAGAPRGVPFDQRDAEMRAAGPIELVRYVPSNPADRYDWDVRLLDLKPKFVTFSSFETEGLDRLAMLREPPNEYALQVERYKAFAERLQKEYDLKWGAQFNPWVAVHDLMYIRPNIWVWERKTDSAKPSSGSSTTSITSGAPAGTR